MASPRKSLLPEVHYLWSFEPQAEKMKIPVVVFCSWSFLSCGVLPENLSWLKGAEGRNSIFEGMLKKNSFHLTRKSLGK